MALIGSFKSPYGGKAYSQKMRHVTTRICRKNITPEIGMKIITQLALKHKDLTKDSQELDEDEESVVGNCIAAFRHVI